MQIWYLSRRSASRTQASLLSLEYIQGLRVTEDIFLRRVTSVEKGTILRSKRSVEFFSKSHIPRRRRGLLRGGKEAGPQAAEWPPSQPIGM